MASSLISAFVIVLFMAVGARAALLDLGEACTSSDTCVHPTLKLVCDVMAAKCLIQVGQTCNGDGNSVYCVTGAKCDTASHLCTCDTTGSIYSANTATGTCTAVADSYGAACGTCTAASKNLLCAASSKCTCTNATFVYATDTGNCVALANAKIGKTCTIATQATDCGDATTTFMTCVSLACACNKGYTGVVGGTCSLIAATKIGHGCTTGTAAADCGTGANLACDATNLVCQCATGYTGVLGGVCFPVKGALKGGCAADADCGSGKLCTQEMASVPKTCKTSLAAGAACTTDTAGTACGAGLTCDTTCKTLVGLGGDCSPATTKCNTGLTCTNTKCGIADNYNGGSCIASTALSQGSCTSSANTVCGGVTGGVCLCKTGYSADPPSDCAVKAKMYGGTCSTATPNTKGDCNDVSLVCSATPSGTCACATGYSGGVNGQTCYADKSLGGACSGGSACSDSNAECTTLKCTCKTDYVAWNGKCVLKAGTLSAGTCSGKTCVDGSTCSTTTNTCTCSSPYTENSGVCQAAANLYGGPCTVTAAKPVPVGTCTDTNSNCVDGFCVCKDNYIGNLGGTCRLISGAGTVTLSISLLMLQLAACVWQVFPA